MQAISTFCWIMKVLPVRMIVADVSLASAPKEFASRIVTGSLVRGDAGVMVIPPDAFIPAKAAVSRLVDLRSFDYAVPDPADLLHSDFNRSRYQCAPPSSELLLVGGSSGSSTASVTESAEPGFLFRNDSTEAINLSRGSYAGAGPLRIFVLAQHSPQRTLRLRIHRHS
jgi:hypothetical protein